MVDREEKAKIMAGPGERVKTTEDHAEKAKTLEASDVRTKMQESEKKVKTLAACVVIEAPPESQFQTTTWRSTRLDLWRERAVRRARAAAV